MLTPFQAKVLDVLSNKNEEAIPPRKILQRLGIERPNPAQRASLSRSLARLSAQGLVVGLRVNIEFRNHNWSPSAPSGKWLASSEGGSSQRRPAAPCTTSPPALAWATTIALGDTINHVTVVWPVLHGIQPRSREIASGPHQRLRRKRLALGGPISLATGYDSSITSATAAFPNFAVAFRTRSALARRRHRAPDRPACNRPVAIDRKTT
jgi:hypothetical protein